MDPRSARRSLWSASCALLLCVCAHASEPRGFAALVALQDADGAWRSKLHKPLRDGPGLTAFVLDSALLLPAETRAPHAAALARARDYLLTRLGKRDSFDPAACSYPTYATAYTLSALTRINRAEDAAVRKRLIAGLLRLQLADGLGWAPADARYGGWGVGMGQRKPVASYVGVSTTRAALGALARAGLPADHPARKKARAFLARCQRADGGFAFSPDAPAAKNGFGKDGAPAPYGSATADGLLALRAVGGKSPKARAWLLRQFDVQRVPGFGEKPTRDWPGALRLYWLAVAAEALPGKRAEIRAAVLKAQRADGSWKGGSALMMENDPRLATALALRALAFAKP